MLKRISICVILIFLASFRGYSQDLESKINELVKPLMDGKKNLGFAIGVYDIDSETPRMFYFGRTSKDDETKVSETTVFEIGSITKTFTTTMAVMLERDGKIKLGDPVQNYLPDGVTIHNFSSQEPVKLIHLATQTSGLPRLPANLTASAKTDAKDPYKNYGEEELNFFINNYIPESEPGTKYLYSNLGMGLLGHIMERASGKTYDELLHYYLTDSLGMFSTGQKLSAEMQKNMAKGYTEKGEPTPLWDFDVLAGCGSIRSSLPDMMKYLAFHMGKTDKFEFKEALTQLHKRRFETDIPNTAIGLAWHVSETSGDRTVIWHNGGTGGFASFMGFIPETNTGVVVLTNQANSVDNVGVEILKYLNRLK
jgi:CubicO group peptidase (beta-lactamase class C family)